MDFDIVVYPLALVFFLTTIFMISINAQLKIDAETWKAKYEAVAVQEDK